MAWRIVYWVNTTGKAPAKDFIDDLPLETRVKVRNLYRYILEFGPNLGPPHMKHISGYKPLKEFRVVGEGAIRLLGWIDGSYIIIAHVFRKKTQKIPQKEIDVAYRRWKHSDISVT